MNLNRMLLKRHSEGHSIRVGLIGAGKFGTMFLAQARRMIGLQVVGVAEREPARPWKPRVGLVKQSFFVLRARQ